MSLVLRISDCPSPYTRRGPRNLLFIVGRIRAQNKDHSTCLVGFLRLSANSIGLP